MGRRLGILLLPVAIILNSGCVYFNTFFSAQQKFREAERSQRENRAKQQSQQSASQGKPTAPGGQMGQQPNRPPGSFPGASGLSPVSAQDRALYEDAIRKASKVLKYHPNSKWIDDALWLIGKSYYNMGDYILADRKFKELVTNHPESKYSDDAYYYMGLCQMNLGHNDLALSAFSQIETAAKKSPYLEDTYFAKGAIEMSRENYPEAIEYFTQYVDKYPHGDSAAKATFDIGVCKERTRDYMGAYTAYSSVTKHHPDKELYFNAVLASAAAALRTDSISIGMRILNELGNNEKYYSRSSDIHLKTAEGYYLQGNTDQAIDTYKEVTSQNPRTDDASEAYYRLGLIYQNDKFDMAAAKEAFSKAQTESPGSQFRNLALVRSAQIAKLETYQRQLQKADSLEKAERERPRETQPSIEIDSLTATAQQGPETLSTGSVQAPPQDSVSRAAGPDSSNASSADMSKTAQPIEIFTVRPDSGVNEPPKEIPKPPANPAPGLSEKAKSDSVRQAILESGIESRYLLAELYAYELNRPDSALREYLLIADEYRDSPYAAKSLLAAAHIEYDRQDTSAANGYLRRLVAEHPRSPQAAEAALLLNSPFDLSNNAIGLYAIAESLVFMGNNPDSALKLFKYIEHEFPDLAPKASFAAAWVLDQQIGVSDSSAYYAYSDVIKKYPQTPYADAATERLSVKVKPAKTRTQSNEQPQPEKPDQSPDSLKQGAQGLPPAPKVKTLAEFVYPNQLLSKDLKGRVIFKIKLDVTGRVEDYEIIGPSGESAIDSSATAALLQTEFDVSQMNMSQLDSYFQYTIPFKRPDIDIFNDPYRRRQEGQEP